MKKKLLSLLPLILLGLSACNNGGGNNSSSQGGGGGGGDLPSGKEVVVIFYLDYNHADEDNPYFKGLWYYGKPIDRDQFTNENDDYLVDPTDDDASYQEFGHFVGWSEHPIIDDEKDLWNFETDTKGLDARGKFLQLYGIWLEE